MKKLENTDISELLSLEKACGILKEYYTKSANVYRGHEPKDLYENTEFHDLMKKYQDINTLHESVLSELGKRVSEYEKTDRED